MFYLFVERILASLLYLLVTNVGGVERIVVFSCVVAAVVESRKCIKYLL